MISGIQPTEKISEMKYGSCSFPLASWRLLVFLARSVSVGSSQIAKPFPICTIMMFIDMHRPQLMPSYYCHHSLSCLVPFALISLQWRYRRRKWDVCLSLEELTVFPILYNNNINIDFKVWFLKLLQYIPCIWTFINLFCCKSEKYILT